MKFAMPWSSHQTDVPPIPSVRVSLAPPIVSVLNILQRVLALVILGCVALGGWWWQESQDLEASARRYETATARTEALNQQVEAQLVKDRLTMPGDQLARLQGKIAFANQLADKHAFSWTRLLSDLEETVPPHVSIGSVKLDFQQSTIVLDGMARNLQDVNAFVQSLQQHRAFQQAVLTKHEMQKRHGGVAGPVSSEGVIGQHLPIEFTLAVSYQAAIINRDGAP
jgi:hypothetical protein